MEKFAHKVGDRLTYDEAKKAPTGTTFTFDCVPNIAPSDRASAVEGVVGLNYVVRNGTYNHELKERFDAAKNGSGERIFIVKKVPA